MTVQNNIALTLSQGYRGRDGGTLNFANGGSLSLQVRMSLLLVAISEAELDHLGPVLCAVCIVPNDQGALGLHLGLLPDLN